MCVGLEVRISFSKNTTVTFIISAGVECGIAKVLVCTVSGRLL